MSQYKSAFVNDLVEQIMVANLVTDDNDGQAMATFRAELRPALIRLIERAKADYVGHSGLLTDYPLNQGEEYWETARLVKAGMLEIGVEIDDLTSFSIWELYSQDSSAQWMNGPSTPAEAVGLIENLCDDIAAGQDYLGFSDKGGAGNDHL